VHALLLRCSRLAKPSRPSSAGNSARNQWKARLPAVMVQRSTRNFLPVRRRMFIHADSGAAMCSLNRAGAGGEQWFNIGQLTDVSGCKLQKYF
jgi:hypothetical protein